MRFMMRVQWDIEKGNALARSGELGPTMEAILGDLKPEAVYFAAIGGNRSAYVVVHMDDVSQMPAIAEPWFLALNATVQFEPVMLPDDLQKAGPSIEAAAKKFG